MVEPMPSAGNPAAESAGEGGPAGEAKRCGFVAILGAPNAGKSTLVNALVGAKVSIVSPKVQTTRTRVLGIAMAGAAQLILVDTPGIFAPRRRLDRAMIASAWQGAKDADLLCLIVDAARGLDDDTRRIVSALKQAGRKAILVLNKIDRVKKPSLLALADELNREAVFTDSFMISALSGDGVGDLRAYLAARLQPGPWLFPEDQLSDLPMRLLAAELVREQVFIQLRQEIPYASAVDLESWEEFDDGSAKVSASIYVERESQRGIVLGKGGARIKAIGSAARHELAELLGRPVHLMLHVKVAPDWQERPELYRALRLDFDV
ncbi:MAG TPA: GTPase Era [Alphaproteobacteria bacterium]|nr:GTPase Era [Alphaproteobacteria bacterium]